VLILATIPLAFSILSLLWQHNCAFWDGLLFYIEITYPSAMLGGLLGIIVSFTIRRQGWAVFTLVCFWFVTLILSLLPGYTNPQLFTYGWQYGFFPGLTWDES